MGNIRFDESKYFGEDLPFSDQLLTKLGKDRETFKELPAVSYPLYFYNNGREGSNMQVHDDLVRKGIIPAPVVEYKE